MNCEIRILTCRQHALDRQNDILSVTDLPGWSYSPLSSVKSSSIDGMVPVRILFLRESPSRNLRRGCNVRWKADNIVAIRQNKSTYSVDCPVCSVLPTKEDRLTYYRQDTNLQWNEQANKSDISSLIDDSAIIFPHIWSTYFECWISYRIQEGLYQSKHLKKRIELTWRSWYRVRWLLWDNCLINVKTMISLTIVDIFTYFQELSAHPVPMEVGR